MQKLSFFVRCCIKQYFIKPSQPSLEEITKQVEIVRASHYVKSKKQGSYRYKYFNQFLLIKKSSEFDNLIAQAEILLLCNQELIDEFIAVTKRSKFKKYFDINDIQAILLMIKDRAVFIEVTSDPPACRGQ